MKRFLSLLMALTLVASLFTVNVMAASKQRTATLSADVTEDLSAGDTVVVSVILDTTDYIQGAQYTLQYDKDAFAIDTTKGWKIGMKKYENFLDQTWYTDMVDSDNNAWAAFVSNPTITYAVEGEIYCAWADTTGTSYIDPEYAEENDVIGKFIFTVKDGAEAGDYTFGLAAASYSLDNGENAKTDWIVNAETVTVAGEDTPVEPEVTVPEATADALTGGVAGNAGENYDNAAMTTATFTNIADIVKVGVLFIPTALLNGDLNLDTADVANAEYAGALDNLLGDGAYTLKAALRGIPRKYHAGIGITSRAYAVYGDNAVKYAEPKAGTITFAETAE